MNKFYDAIMGLVVGDALGVPFEFRQRDTFEATGMTGYGTHNQPPGTWSDDTSMTLATIDSLCVWRGINLKDMMFSFRNWLYRAEYTPWGQVFDVGNTTRMAIARHVLGVGVDRCGGTSERENGNGSLMRILPLAFVPGITSEDVRRVSGLTHAHEVSVVACEIYLDVAKLLLAGVPVEEAIVMAAENHLNSKFVHLFALDRMIRDEIRSTGYVVDTLEAALWCLLHTSNYRDCVLTAVNLGEDTDTIAAVAGGLAGILYGVGGDCGIPLEWIKKIARKDWIIEKCRWFDSVFSVVRR